MKKLVFIVFITIFAVMVGNNVVAQSKPFVNPKIIYGSDFMTFMQSLRKIGNYDMMLQFTSSKSIKKFGKEKIVAYYKEKFTNMSKLKLNNVNSNSDGTKTLEYTNLVAATKYATSVTIIIENDSCKLILPSNLKNKLLN